MFCRNCGSENLDSSKFCAKCGSKLVKNARLIQKTISDETIQENKKNKVKLSSNKKIIIGILALFIVMGGCLLFGYNYKNKNVSISQIKEDLIGEVIYVDAIDVKLTKKNIKNVKIEKKNTEKENGIYYYSANASVTIEEKGYTLTIPITINYNKVTNSSKLETYLGEPIKKNKWFKDYITPNTNKAVFKIKEELNSDTMKKLIASYGENSSTITKDMLKGVKLKKECVSANGTIYNVTGTVQGDYGAIKINRKIVANIKFNGEKWTCTDVSDDSIEIEQNKEVKAKEALNGLKQLIGKNEVIIFSDSSLIMQDISADDITEFEFTNLESSNTSVGSNSYKLIGNVKGISNKLSFTGQITVDVSYGYINAMIETNSISVKEPTIDEIKSSIIGEEIYCDINNELKTIEIDKQIANTFILDEIIVDKNYPYEFHVFGTISYEGITNDKIYLNMDYDINEDKFTVYENEVSNNNDYFDEYYNKDNFR